MPTCVRADKITKIVEKEGFREEEWQIMKCGIHICSCWAAIIDIQE